MNDINDRKLLKISQGRAGGAAACLSPGPFVLAGISNAMSQEGT